LRIRENQQSRAVLTRTSVRFDQEALGDAKLGHGLFTYAVVRRDRGSTAALAAVF
jgi:hypothetical protein